MKGPFTDIIYKSGLVSSMLHERRIRRLNKMLSLVQIEPGMKILDVGCGPNGRSFHSHLDLDCEVLGIDLYDPDEVVVDSANFTYRKQDARDLSEYGDGEFDLVVSIGMMEHICHLPDIEQMAREIHRVGRQFVILVPWRYVLIEPHFKWPLFQFTPVEIQNRLVIALNLHGLAERVRQDPLYISKNYMWLTAEQWTAIWPESVAHVFNFETYMIAKSAPR